MLKIKNLIISLIIISVVFISEYKNSFFGEFVNIFSQCTTRSDTSFLCYMIYDIYFLITLIGLFIINVILLIVSLIKIMIKNKNAKNRIG